MDQKNSTYPIALTSSNKPAPCKICGKQSIYNMTCRCSESLCRRHWIPAKHNCAFDFAAHANCRNSERLPKIESQKIASI